LPPQAVNLGTLISVPPGEDDLGKKETEKKTGRSEKEDTVVIPEHRKHVPHLGKSVAQKSNQRTSPSKNASGAAEDRDEIHVTREIRLMVRESLRGRK
jgi:hypothetical protein